MGLFDRVQSYWPAAIGAAIVYITGRWIYRLYFHPLAKFPGPKIAAMTLWYEWYYDAPLRGQYIFKIKEMHEKYGPIVRITPDELHVNDPEFIPELYPAGGRKRDKYRRAMQLFGFTEAAISTVEHDLHRVRRGAMSRMFSKDSVRRLEPIMQANLNKLFKRFQELKESGEPVNLLHVYSAFTNDLITEYAFGISYNWLDAPKFNHRFFDFITSFHEMGAMANMFSWYMPLVNSLPDSFVKKINPGYADFLTFKEDLQKQINGVVQRHREGKDNHTVFDEILDSNLPEFEKRPERLLEDAQNIAIAGTETTAWSLSVIEYHLLNNPSILRKLKAELEVAMPDLEAPVYIKEVEQLPYLTALISEGLRIGMGTSNRQFRIAPDEVLRLDDGKTEWLIPKGTPVAMTTPWIHLNPDIFPDPLTFNPQRFIDNPRLKRYIMAFSQGSRQCLGMQLAYAELYLVLAGVWRRFGSTNLESDMTPEEHAKHGIAAGIDCPLGRFELFETDRRDLEMEYDLFVPYGKKDSQGIRVVVK